MVHKPDIEPHQLSATERCIRRDLDLPRHVVAEPPADQRKHHPLLAAFYERRAQSPIGQETIEGLQANIVAYSLHAGRWRGLTWHEQQFAIVWLLWDLDEVLGEVLEVYGTMTLTSRCSPTTVLRAFRWKETARREHRADRRAAHPGVDHDTVLTRAPQATAHKDVLDASFAAATF